MRLIPIPGSSQIAALGYDADQEVLVAQFQGSGGALYRYTGVPSDAFVAVITSKESVGKAFNAHVKNKAFPYEKVEAEDVLNL